VAGAGFNSGIRDATNLGWKLAMVVQGKAAPALLDTYHTERHDHAKAMIDVSVAMGKIFAPPNALQRFVRDVAFATSRPRAELARMDRDHALETDAENARRALVRQGHSRQRSGRHDLSPVPRGRCERRAAAL
jgi:2-polyprenyl-6-methoxyphenol hydroxylase-like FAD-dependent oxidoreductase